MTKAGRDARFDGTIVAEGTVTAKGRIEDIKILNSPGLGLDKSVIKTLKKWRCTPPIGSGGAPIVVRASFQVRFRPDS